MYGGASQQYADAITNVDKNLAEILEAVNRTSGEQWTIIVVTDHGHHRRRASVTASNHRLRHRHS